MAKVWNITDHPGTDRPTRVMLVLGRSVRPGKCINVPEDRLVNAHKVNRAVAAKKLFIGPKPPMDYLLAKAKGLRAELAPGTKRAHGPMPEVPLSGEAEAAAGKALGLQDTVGMKDEVTAELKGSEPVEPTKVEDDDSASKKGKKRGRF